MKKDIKELEKKLRAMTGEDKLPKGEIDKAGSKKPFNSSAFIKLAKEVKKIFEEENANNPAIRLR